MVIPNRQLGSRRVSGGDAHSRKPALSRVFMTGLIAATAIATPVIAGTVLQGNFNRSPAYPSTPNGRFPQETAQIIQFKQEKVLQQQGMSPHDARSLATRGVILSAAAMIGLGENNAQISHNLSVGGGTLATIGGVMCYSGYGCAVGGPLAIVGMIASLGGSALCLVTDCSITASGHSVDDVVIAGSDVRAVERKVVSGTQAEYPHYNTAYASSNSSNVQELVNSYGINREYVSTGGSPGAPYLKTMIVGFTPAPNGQLRSTFGDYVQTCYSCTPSSSSNRLADTLMPGTVSAGTGYWRTMHNGPCVGYLVCSVYYFTQGYPSAGSIPKTEYVPVQQVPMYALGSGSSLPPESAAKDVSPALMESFANEVWKRQGAQAPVPWSDAMKVTNQDVAEFRATYPDRVSKLSDLARPINAPGQQPNIGPIQSPIAPPQQVEITNPALNPNPADSSNPGSGKGDEPDNELDNDAGLLGDVMAPVRDFIAGPFKSFMTPGIAIAQPPCPNISIDLPTLLGRQDLSNKQDFQQACDWMMAQRPLLVTILRVMFSFGAFLVVMRFS